MRSGTAIDLAQLPGWQEADEPTQRRIIEGAKTYIQQQDNVDDGWIETNTWLFRVQGDKPS